MPIRILRSFIEQILPHSSMTQVNKQTNKQTHRIPLRLLSSFIAQVSIFDVHDRLVDDSHLVSSLPPHNHSSSSSSSSPIPLRFTLVNTVTSLAHCPCASSPSLLSTRAREQRLTSSASPNLIRRETIDRTLSTCALLHKRPASPLSPCLSTPPFDSCASTSMSMSIVNLLSPPSSHSSFLMDNNNNKNNATGVDTALQQQQAMIDEITSQFGEICPPLPKKTRKRATNKAVRLSLPSSLASSNAPLDLSVKKRASPSPSSFFPAQTKWIRT